MHMLLSRGRGTMPIISALCTVTRVLTRRIVEGASDARRTRGRACWDESRLSGRDGPRGCVQPNTATPSTLTCILHISQKIAETERVVQTGATPSIHRRGRGGRENGFRGHGFVACDLRLFVCLLCCAVLCVCVRVCVCVCKCV